MRIWLEGSCGVPRPCRTNASTIDIRTKQVVISSTAGARLATPNMSAAESVASSERVPRSFASIAETAVASPRSAREIGRCGGDADCSVTGDGAIAGIAEGSPAGGNAAGSKAMLAGCTVWAVSSAATAGNGRAITPVARRTAT